jgi:hypothetical protein
MASFLAPLPRLFARASHPRPARRDDEGWRALRGGAAGQASGEPGDAPTPADAQGGPGWFDSSWELQRGLEVREGLPGDAGLDEWLGAFCAGGAPMPYALAA